MLCCVILKTVGQTVRQLNVQTAEWAISFLAMQQHHGRCQLGSKTR
jgi:hypothetical protein